MTRRLIVVGTGTGVGKTWVAEALARQLGARALRVAALKPVETGVVEGAADTDFARLSAASSFHVQQQPYRFEPPLSPHLAARRVGRTIDLATLLTYVQSHESSAPDWTLVETAGGLFSPLAPTLTNFDLARALDPATWLLVGPDALGVLHDVTATLGLARSRGRAPDHLLLSASRAPDESTGTNAAELEALSLAPRVFSARHADPSSLTAFVDVLLRSHLGD
jgi:dethiobiotin synthetase